MFVSYKLEHGKPRKFFYLINKTDRVPTDILCFNTYGQELAREMENQLNR